MRISRRERKQYHHHMRKSIRAAKRRLWVFFIFGLVIITILWIVSKDVIATLVLLGAVGLYFFVKSITLKRYH